MTQSAQWSLEVTISEWPPMLLANLFTVCCLLSTLYSLWMRQTCPEFPRCCAVPADGLRAQKSPHQALHQTPSPRQSPTPWSFSLQPTQPTLLPKRITNRYDYRSNPCIDLSGKVNLYIYAIFSVYMYIFHCDYTCLVNFMISFVVPPLFLCIYAFTWIDIQHYMH